MSTATHKTTRTAKTSKTSKTPKAAPKTPARSKELAQLAEAMRGIDLCMMTTQGARGAHHTRPMSNNGKVDFDGDAWFFTSKKTAKVREIRKDPRVSLSYVGGTKKAPTWIAVSGKARIVDDVAKKTELWVPDLDRWFENGPEDPSVVLVHVVGARASWWSYEGEGEVDLG